jgi:hypothetical protein
MSPKFARTNARMSNDEYAGFLRLMLTPLTQEPKPSPELDAYLAYLNREEPVLAVHGPHSSEAA